MSQINKNDLVKRIADREDVTQAQAHTVITSLVEIINEAARDGDDVAIPELGKFVVQSRAERTMRNPATDQPMTLPATFVVKFRPAARLKESAAS